SEAKILRQAFRVIGRAHELIRLPQALPLLGSEGGVAALGHIIIRRNDVQWRRISRRISVREVGKPGDKAGSLRDFVWNLPVGALIFRNEFQRRARGCEIAFSIQCECGPKRIAPEKPRESRTLARAGSSIARDQSRAQG